MVSVIIPAFNRAQVIRRSVESVLNQSYKDIEVIVVDDCSKDNTEDILALIKDARLKYYRLDKNSGACAARNKGIELACGEYIAFQDSDDEWYQNKIENQLNTLKLNDADLVFCGFEKVFSDGTKKIIPQGMEKGFYTQRELIYESVVSTQTILGKAEVIRDIGFDVKMPRMQDYDFIIRASEKYLVYFLDQVLVRVYEQPDSITASKKQYQKRLDVTKQLLEKYIDLVKKYPEWEIKMLKTVAHCEVMLKIDAEENLKIILNKEKNIVNLAKLVLYKMGVLGFFLNMK